ncbi:MAG: deoxyribose-phosphate aldolase [Thermoplasmata archaeon]
MNNATQYYLRRESQMSEKSISVQKILGLIDHTKLKPFETEEGIRELIEEAVKFGTYSVCIEPSYLKLSREIIDSNKLDVKIAVVVDFPFGGGTTESRVMMINEYSKMAEELDIVVQIGFVKSKRFDVVKEDLRRVVSAAHSNNRLIKIIVEDAYTMLDEKKELYKIVMESGADFIKTGTGFEDKEYASSLGNKTGAQVENVRLMAEYSAKYNPDIGIKAAGGIHTYANAVSLLQASGKEPNPRKFRIGASSTEKIKESAVQ